jgi:hypothetical protein
MDGKNCRKGEYHIGPQENCDAKIFLSKVPIERQACRTIEIMK